MINKKTVSVLLSAAAILAFIVSPLYAAEKKAPNFILFYMDDYSWNQTSFRMMDSEPDSQHSFYETPHLEKLAERGVRFTNGYCPTPTCTGSRVSIQFGQTSARIQYRFVHDVLSKYQRPNGYSDEIAMGGILKAAGKNYTTAHFGKGAGGAVGQLKNYGYNVTDEYEKYGPNGNGHGNSGTADDPKRIFSLTRDAVKFVNKNAGERPFFMMVSHYAAHVRHAALQKDIDRFQKKYNALPNKPKDPKELIRFSQQNNVLYGAMVYEADWSLGEIIKAVKEKGELDNTYIIFTADNGSECLPRDEDGHYYSGPLQMGKYSTFEGGIRVPFVVAGQELKLVLNVTFRLHSGISYLRFTIFLAALPPCRKRSMAEVYAMCLNTEIRAKLNARYLAWCSISQAIINRRLVSSEWMIINSCGI